RALAEYLDRGDSARAVRSAGARSRPRRQYLERAVAERMPAARVTGMPAGLHCLLELPDGIQESDVMRRADAVGIALEGLQTYRMPAREPVRAEGVAARPPAMVVGFGAPPPHLFEQAVEAALAAIAAASRRYRGRARSPAPSARQSERARSALASVADIAAAPLTGSIGSAERASSLCSRLSRR
ncbi:MAG: hypothetical protein ACTHNC_17405, partial [Humibacter sp.]